MTTLVEKMAQQIALKVYGGYPMDREKRERWRPEWPRCKRAARAVLKAMEEPTEAMLEAGNGNNIPGASFLPAFPVWQAMIRCAIEEAEQERAR